MFENVFETVIRGSNTIFLNIPENDYFLNYKDIDIESAEEITGNYFDVKGKDGIPHVKNVDFDSSTHKVKIAVDVEKDRSKMIPDGNVRHIRSIKMCQ